MVGVLAVPFTAVPQNRISSFPDPDPARIMSDANVNRCTVHPGDLRATFGWLALFRTTTPRVFHEHCACLFAEKFTNITHRQWLFLVVHIHNRVPYARFHTHAPFLPTRWQIRSTHTCSVSRLRR